MSEPRKSLNLLRVEGIELVDIEDGGEKYARVSDLLAAGWVPPEEAEALLARIEEATRKVASVQAVMSALDDRVTTIEASWIRPERVEEIDCPRCPEGGLIEGRVFQRDSNGVTTTVVCRVCRGSGKLRIAKEGTD